MFAVIRGTYELVDGFKSVDRAVEVAVELLDAAYEDAEVERIVIDEEDVGPSG